MYSEKYKERNPKETVKIIKDFFNSKELKIKENICTKSEIGTYFCAISAFSGNILLYSTNGKGMSEELAKASAYAELYERFCNSFERMVNPIIFKQFYNLKTQKNGYCFSPKEKQVDFEEIINNNSLNTFYNTLIPDIEYRNKYFQTIIGNNKALGIPFNNYNYNKLDNQYYDLRLCQIATKSTGMAAGNTLDEALNQGLSEFYERYVHNLFYKFKEDKYYELDVLNMNIPMELKEKIHNIKSHKNYDIKFFDLGYNFNLPVILGVLIDKEKFKIIPNLGSFAVFDIALERVVTELFQGVYSYEVEPPGGPLGRTQQPFLKDKYYDSFYLNSNSSYGHLSMFDEYSIINLNNIKTTKYSKVFLDNSLNYNNKQIRDFYINLNLQNEIDIYYFDLSLIPEMKSIYLFSPNIYPFPSTIEGMKEIHNWKQILNNYFYYYDKAYSILNNNSDIKLEDLPKFYAVNKYEAGYTSHFLNWNCFFSAESGKRIGITTYPYIFNKILNINNIKEFYQTLNELDVIKLCPYKKIKQFLTIFNYLKFYSPTEVYNLFKKLGYNINMSDILNVDNKEYIINRCFVDSWKESYKDPDLIKYLLALC